MRRSALPFLLPLLLSGTVTAGEMAVTFDDLPQAGPPLSKERAAAMTEGLLSALAKHGVKATGFVNESRVLVPGGIDARVALLERWLEAGHELGNHTFSHPSFQTTPLEPFREDVIRGETLTRMLLERRGAALRFFRHPFLQTGPTLKAKDELEAFLKGRGYRVAPVTVDNADYVFAALYADARTAGDAALAARLREAYVAYLPTMLDFFDGMAKHLLGRDVRHVLLLHANELNADAFDALAVSLKARGTRFVPLPHALEDPAYALPDRFAGAQGLSWLHRWLFTREGRTRLKEEPDPPEWVLALWRARPR